MAVMMYSRTIQDFTFPDYLPVTDAGLLRIELHSPVGNTSIAEFMHTTTYYI